MTALLCLYLLHNKYDDAGSMRELDVIDVARQQDCKMLMRDWTEYYSSEQRRKIYNVISLEFTNTK